MLLSLSDRVLGKGKEKRDVLSDTRSLERPIFRNNNTSLGYRDIVRIVLLGFTIDRTQTVRIKNFSIEHKIRRYVNN